MKLHVQLVSGLLLALLGTVSVMATEASAPPAQASPAGDEGVPVKPKTTTVYTELKVCGEEAGCGASTARWASRAVLKPAAKDTPREFKWKTNVPGVTQGRWEVSPKPFPLSPGSTPRIVASGDAGTPEQGTFSVKLADLPSYYVRVVPLVGGQPTGRSNIVMVQYREAKPPKTEKPAQE